MGSGQKTAVIIAGFVIVIGGLAFGAHQLGIPAMWIGVFSIVLLGIGVISAASNTESADAS